MGAPNFNVFWTFVGVSPRIRHLPRIVTPNFCKYEEWLFINGVFTHGDGSFIDSLAFERLPTAFVLTRLARASSSSSDPDKR
jgi:hypothetical protein